jgi:hypothetical protein
MIEISDGDIPVVRNTVVFLTRATSAFCEVANLIEIYRTIRD